MLAKELSSLQSKREQLKAEVEKYKECDPQVVEEIRKSALQLKCLFWWGKRVDSVGV
jgi:cell division protein FtsB